MNYVVRCTLWETKRNDHLSVECSAFFFPFFPFFLDPLVFGLWSLAMKNFHFQFSKSKCHERVKVKVNLN